MKDEEALEWADLIFNPTPSTLSQREDPWIWLLNPNPKGTFFIKSLLSNMAIQLTFWSCHPWLELFGKINTQTRLNFTLEKFHTKPSTPKTSFKDHTWPFPLVGAYTCDESRSHLFIHCSIAWKFWTRVHETFGWSDLLTTLLFRPTLYESKALLWMHISRAYFWVL